MPLMRWFKGILVKRAMLYESLLVNRHQNWTCVETVSRKVMSHCSHRLRRSCLLKLVERTFLKSSLELPLTIDQLPQFLILFLQIFILFLQCCGIA